MAEAGHPRRLRAVLGSRRGRPERSADRDGCWREGTVNVRSLFSGAGGLDLGLERAGLRAISQCEKDPWRRRVLKWHWPDVPCAEDVRDIPRARSRNGCGMGANDVHHALKSAGTTEHGVNTDLLCGGFPCQDLSVAGRRAGLNGTRSGLFFEFARVAAELRPRWLLVENVPGLLS